MSSSSSVCRHLSPPRPGRRGRPARVRSARVWGGSAGGATALLRVALVGLTAWTGLRVGLASPLPEGRRRAGSDAGAQAQSAAPAFTPRELRIIARMAKLGPPPADATNRAEEVPGAAILGQRLFFDPRLSGFGELSCASCHDPDHSFADGRPLAVGRVPLTRHTPALWNVAHQRWLFWDGRADSLWSQALIPVEHPDEMASNRLHVAHVIAGDPVLRREYEGVFGRLPPLEDGRRFPAHARPGVVGDPGRPDERGVDLAAEVATWTAAWSAMAAADREAATRVFANASKAIAAYERLLASDGSPFDRFARALLAGEAPSGAGALSASAQRGLQLFIGRAGCRSCHGGPLFSDREFHDTRVPPLRPELAVDAGRHAGIALLRASPFRASGPYSDAPGGRRARLVERLAPLPRNFGELRTPSLRNVARTAPYMHQGQFATLEEVVHFYSTLEGALPPAHHAERVLRPLRLAPREEADLVAFLQSLTDEGLAPGLLRAIDPK